MKDYTIGDTPRLSGRVSADLTGATMEAHVKRPDGTFRTTSDCVVPTGLDETSGSWTALFANGDLDLEGLYGLEVKVTYSSGETETFATDSDGVQLSFLARRGFEV